MRNLLLAIVGVFFVSTANAGVRFEPYAGYELGSYKAKYVPTLGGGSFAGNANGIGAGARLAYMFPALLFVGGDFQYSSVRFEDTTADPGITKSKDDATRTAVYALAGFEFLMGFRVYAGVGVYNKLEIKSTSTGTTTTFSGGNNMKLGVGFRVAPKVAINIDYITRTYSSFESGSAARDVSTIYETFNDNTIMAGLSIPL